MIEEPLRPGELESAKGEFQQCLIDLYGQFGILPKGIATVHGPWGLNPYFTLENREGVELPEEIERVFRPFLQQEEPIRIAELTIDAGDVNICVDNGRNHDQPGFIYMSLTVNFTDAYGSLEVYNEEFSKHSANNQVGLMHALIGVIKANQEHMGTRP